MGNAHNQSSSHTRRWFFQRPATPASETGAGRKPPDEGKNAWWRVMCLTGVDYFSSLSYQAGIAFLAAGALCPLATLILVLVTLFGAVPVYCRVAEASPHGEGSIAMLERLFPGWRGKTVVLCLLGFAGTDFIITITLSAADAAAHIIQNPWVPDILRSQMTVTLLLLTLLGLIFLKGFREAIGVSVLLVASYLLLTLVIILVGFQHLFTEPHLLADWQAGLMRSHGSPLAMAAISLVVFPKLALGLSGFETGVAVMPLVRGSPGDSSDLPAGRIVNTKHLLRTAAGIMSLFLISSSLICTLLIAPADFAPGAPADGRALSFLGHKFLGPVFGSVYDVSCVAILWFAGASALAGLLSLVPRYLPRYGMAPEWARAMRPLVVFFMLVAYAVTIIFDANVDAQGGAYATGVLVLMTSAALAVTLSLRREPAWRRFAFGLITLVFIYTTVTNCFERPDGIHIASFFIGTILVTSFVSRALRSTELRIRGVEIDEAAERFLAEAATDENIRLVAHRPDGKDYEREERDTREAHNLPDGQILFLEVAVADASEFTSDMLHLRGIQKGPYRVLQCQATAVANALAAVALAIRDSTGRMPHLYLSWTEGNPFASSLRYLFLGEGETAPITREVLREAEPASWRRPRVHVA